MSTTRVFLLAPVLARLIERERGGHLVRQGYFPDRPERGARVQVEGETGQLILVTHHPNGPVEQATPIPRSQAEALLELTIGRTEHLSISVNIGAHTTTLQRFIAPAPLDLISIAFQHDTTARTFQPLAWFGPEVTADPAFQSRSMALAELPSAPEGPTSAQLCCGAVGPPRSGLIEGMRL
ncbi:hypothetical protein [Microvirga sp. P5_D2]